MSEILQVAVIGSGPGGAITACTLAEAGKKVTLFEEGAAVEESQLPMTEEIRKYRNGGITIAFGKPSVTYVEGRILGGGSEINSALYHRLPDAVVGEWRDKFSLSFSAKDLLPHYEQIEKDVALVLLSDSQLPGVASKLSQGARALGWKCVQVPRWIYKEDGRVAKNSLSKTYLPRARTAGTNIKTQHRVTRLRRSGKNWSVEGTNPSGPFRFECASLFLCGGAIQTPFLLRKSGLRTHAGKKLFLHPTIKLVAEFPDDVNSADAEVGSIQVKEFSPRLSFGCSVSKPDHLAVALLDHPHHLPEVVKNWRRHGIYYCMVNGASRGQVRHSRLFSSAKVDFDLHDDDGASLLDGVAKLCELLFRAGAIKIYPTIRGAPILSSGDTLPSVSPVDMRLTSLHLMGSCSMGEDPRHSTVNSHGAVHGLQGLYINDASLFCSSVGVNPQGGILALARRNALQLLEGRS